MNEKSRESDWKLLRKIVPLLRERYLQEKNVVLIGILSDDDKTPSEQFWEAFEQMEKEAKILQDCFDDHRRATMLEKMALMSRFGLLKEEDFEGFSEELQECLKPYRDGGLPSPVDELTK